MSFWNKFKEQVAQDMEKQNIKNQERKEYKKDDKDRIKQYKREGIAHCPKCKSTSIQYIEHRKILSVGRAITGGVLLGPLGAGLGAVTSKKRKGSIKCLNCNHKWKS